MAIDAYVLFDAEQCIAATEWQDRLAETGFGLRLTTGFDSENHHGYIPCYFRGRELGFEYGLQPLQNTGLALADPVTENFSACATLSVPAGSPCERIGVAVLAAAVLARSTGGLLWHNGSFIDSTDPVVWAQDAYPLLATAERQAS